MTSSRLISKFLAAVFLIGLTASPLAARAQTEGGASVVRVDMAAGAQSQALQLPQGRSAVVELPTDARDVLISNPKVAEATLRTPRRIYMLGLKSGVTDAVFFDAAGRRILTLNVRVEQNTSAMADTINRLLGPASQVKVDAINESVILSGTVASLSDADKAVQIAVAAVGKPDQVLNMLSIAGKEQVMLKVRIVEMQRQVIKQLGFNWSTIISQSGLTQLAIGTTSTYGINGALLGGIAGGLLRDTTQQPQVLAYDPLTGKYDLPQVCHDCPIATTQTTSGSNGVNKAQGNIQAFERAGLIRTLAEPNLTAVSGESAKFLVGGEFPVPISQDATGRISVEFKTFGVGLGFTPLVLSGGRISLKLSTEVSELSNEGAFSIGTGGAGAPALVIPALNVRRAETMVELPSGGSMMIAGLLQDKSAQNLDSLPGVKDVPVLGALFRSRDFQSGQTELVVIVTPYLVNPASPSDLQTPIDGLYLADDARTMLLGRLNKTFKRSPATTAGKTYQGPYGYVVE
jgi:pilus assembly protein CpaC